MSDKMQELLKQQAAAIGAKNAAIQAAEYHEAMAKMHRTQIGDAKQTSFVTELKAEAKKKRAGVERIAGAMAADKLKSAKTVLATNGFRPLTGKFIEQYAGDPAYADKEGRHIRLGRNSFRVYQFDKVIVPSMELNALESYLVSLKKK